MNDKLYMRVALVTGASRGIGAQISKALASDGRHVVLIARGADDLELTRRQIESCGGHVSAHCCDVTDQTALETAIERITEEHGRLDILVNNVGATSDNLLLRMSDEEFDQVISTNLRSVFVACRAALRPMMRGKWGRIVNISSVAGLVGNAGQANYAAAKAALLGFTKSVAREMGPKNICANVVAPGFIETDMTRNLPQKVKDRAIEATSVKRMGHPTEIAAAVAYLTSENAGFVTGQVLTVDGGLTMC